MELLKAMAEGFGILEKYFYRNTAVENEENHGFQYALAGSRIPIGNCPEKGTFRIVCRENS